MADHGGPIENLLHAFRSGASRNKTIELELFPQACRDLIKAIEDLQSQALQPGEVRVPELSWKTDQAELAYRRAMCDEAPDDVLDPLWDAFDALRSQAGGT